MATKVEKLSRFTGCLMGLAVGDALGTTVEFQPPGSFTPLTGVVGGGPFKLQPGQWTDDTSMALCLGESLRQCKQFDARDQMERYIRWWKEGYLSSTGRCFDIGMTVATALQNFQHNGNPLAGSTDPYSAGNGSLMRLAPIPLFYAEKPKLAIEMAAESSRTTHAAQTCLDACRFYTGLIVGALQGACKEDLLSPEYSPVEGLWQKAPLCTEIQTVACGSYKHKKPPLIVGSGYVVKAMEAALWSFHRSSNFRDGCLLAANLGDDADTTAAIYGQLAGAYYGIGGIPADWRALISEAAYIESLANDLGEGSGG